MLTEHHRSLTKQNIGATEHNTGLPGHKIYSLNMVACFQTIICTYPDTMI